MLKNILKITTLAIFAVSSLNLLGQSRISSPYSYYGIGNLSESKSARLTAMGGISYGFNSPYTVNNSNPASYSSFDSLSFLFEAGGVFNSQGLQNTKTSQNSSYASLGYLFFGFPVTQWWRTSFGLTPYSQIGYKISEDTTLINIGKVQNTYEGNGGVNKVYIGNSFKLFKNFSVGFNASYLFGPIDKKRSIYFPDSVYMISTRVKDDSKAGGFLFDFGLNYKIQIKKTSISFGLIYGLQSNLNVSRNRLVESFTKSTSGIEYIKDTILNTSSEEGKIFIPQKIGGGIGVSINNRWNFGVDYTWQQWEKYTYYGSKDTSMQNMMQVAAGLEFIPNINSNNYLNKIAIRAGFHYTSSSLILKNTSINEFGISFGLGLPLRKSKSSINMTIEYGQKGTTNNNLIKENYTRITIGFSSFDRWFLKAKYD